VRGLRRYDSAPRSAAAAAAGGSLHHTRLRIPRRLTRPTRCYGRSGAPDRRRWSQYISPCSACTVGRVAVAWPGGRGAVRAGPDTARRSGPVAVASSRRSAHSARAGGLAVVMAGGRGYGADSRRPVTGAAMRGSSRRWSQPSAARIEKRILVTLPTDSRAGNAMWLLSVGGRAYAGRNGDLRESC
jgi:hypothetical protein